eukprot:TRINITY_DN2137_c1_g1_i1.p1 TRINITY_DN2137_c1_g1~~TRINITY_DN2137_c1_g1_i1.p1  ORF type:complete len:185 (-),score=88.79 TRINITY_DN2137_c1_g1_i1:136-690(-)
MSFIENNKNLIISAAVIIVLCFSILSLLVGFTILFIVWVPAGVGVVSAFTIFIATIIGFIAFKKRLGSGLEQEIFSVSKRQYAKDLAASIIVIAALELIFLFATLGTFWKVFGTDLKLVGLTCCASIALAIDLIKCTFCFSFVVLFFSDFVRDRFIFVQAAPPAGLSISDADQLLLGESEGQIH